MEARAANEAVLGDLGWWPAKARRDMIRLRYWKKILNMKESRLTKIVYEEERVNEENNDTWIEYTKRLLKELKLEKYWDEQVIKEKEMEWNKMIYKH